MSVIRKVEFVESAVRPGLCTALATMSDGRDVPLFSYYIDELAFDSSELIGLTEAEARALRHRRDVEFLQS